VVDELYILPEHLNLPPFLSGFESLVGFFFVSKDNTLMIKRKRTTIYRTLQRKLKIVHHKPERFGVEKMLTFKYKAQITMRRNITKQ
jgi:hypothetical protein